jgi:hypothetical protein
MASTYLSRTSSTPTNALKWTFSAWVKISGIANDTFLLDFNTDTNNRSQIGFSNDSSEPRFMVYEKVSGSTSQLITTSRLFRDPSAWYHIVVSCDRTLATSSDRTKIYVNGVQETSFTSATYPTQNVTGIINTAVSTLIGKYSQSTLYFDGCLAHYHFIDGTAYDASDFGQTDATTGIWKPKTSPSVTYGTNGFFLKFENSANMDLDSSPNNLTFSTSGNLTQTVDTPSNVYCVWNAINPFGGTLANGNLTVGNNSSYDHNAQGTLGMTSGKWYWEYKMSDTHGEFGVCENSKSPQTDPQTAAGNYFLYNNGNTTGTIFNNVSGNSSSTITVSAFANGQILGCAYDADNEALYIHQNGIYVNSGDPTSGASKTGAIITNLRARYGGTIVPFLGFGTSAARTNFHTNFGNGYFGTTTVSTAGLNGNGAIFEFDCPSGYYALNTKNINTYG